jgi:hypothetical protein
MCIVTWTTPADDIDSRTGRPIEAMSPRIALLDDSADAWRRSKTDRRP